MILHIDQLQAVAEVSVDFDAQQCRLPQEEIGKFLAPIHLVAQARKVEEEITLEGRVSSSLQMTCARCLHPYREALDESFEVVYLPYPEELNAKEELELDEADMNIVYYTDEEIDLTALVHDQVLLLLPVKPLCKADCAGLCPSCGKDLNEGPCSCSHDTVDPRFAVLKTLLASEPSENPSE
jgi:uncharacterized protein